MKMQIRVVSHDSCRYLNFQVITDGHEDHLIDGVSRCPAVAFTAILVVFDVALDALLQMSLLCCRNESDAGNSLTDGDSCGKFTASDVAVQNVSIAADEAFPQSIRIQMNEVHLVFIRQLCRCLYCHSYPLSNWSIHGVSKGRHLV